MLIGEFLLLNSHKNLRNSLAVVVRTSFQNIKKLVSCELDFQNSINGLVGNFAVL